MHVLRDGGNFCGNDYNFIHAECFAKLLHQRLAIHFRRKMQRQLIHHQIAMHVVINLHIDASRTILNNFDVVFRRGNAVVLQLFNDYIYERIICRVIHHQERNLSLQPVLKLIICIVGRDYFEADKNEEQQDHSPNQRANSSAAALPVSFARHRRFVQHFIFVVGGLDNHPKIRLAPRITGVEEPEISHSG